MAGCAAPIGFAGHAPTSATANSELTFHLDHSMGADRAHYLTTRCKPVMAAIDQARRQMLEAAAYTAERAMSEAERALEFAEENKNAMAMVKAVELRAKLAGLLIERIDQRVATVDIGAALEEARGRVLSDGTPHDKTATIKADSADIRSTDQEGASRGNCRSVSGELD